MAASQVDQGPSRVPRGSAGLLRLCGILAFLGLLGYAAMFAGFAYEDRNLLEGIGAAGWALVSVAVLMATIVLTRRGDRPSQP